MFSTMITLKTETILHYCLNSIDKAIPSNVVKQHSTLTTLYLWLVSG